MLIYFIKNMFGTRKSRSGRNTTNSHELPKIYIITEVRPAFYFSSRLCQHKYIKRSIQMYFYAREEERECVFGWINRSLAHEIHMETRTYVFPSPILRTYGGYYLRSTIPDTSKPAEQQPSSSSSTWFWKLAPTDSFTCPCMIKRSRQACLHVVAIAAASAPPTHSKN